MEGEEKKKEEAGGNPLCWRATNGWVFKRHRQVSRREQLGMFNDGRLWEETD